MVHTARRLLTRFTPANIVLVACLVLSLSGTAMAVHAYIGSAQIINGSVRTADLARGAVHRSDIAPSAVDGTRIRNGSIGAADLGTAVRPLGSQSRLRYRATSAQANTLVFSAGGVHLQGGCVSFKTNSVLTVTSDNAWAMRSIERATDSTQWDSYDDDFDAGENLTNLMGWNAQVRDTVVTSTGTYVVLDYFVHSNSGLCAIDGVATVYE